MFAGYVYSRYLCTIFRRDICTRYLYAIFNRGTYWARQVVSLHFFMGTNEQPCPTSPAPPPPPPPTTPPVYPPPPAAPPPLVEQARQNANWVLAALAGRMPTAAAPRFGDSMVAMVDLVRYGSPLSREYEPSQSQSALSALSAQSPLVRGSFCAVRSP